MSQYTFYLSKAICFTSILFWPIGGFGQISNNEIELGEIPLSELMENKLVWYPKIYERYQVKDSILKQRNKALKHYSFKIFIGSWCPESKLFLPKFIKVLQSLKIPISNITVFNISKDKKQPSSLIGVYKIKFVPTVIFYNNGIEQNRIVEYTINSIEEDINSIVGSNNYKNFHYNEF